MKRIIITEKDDVVDVSVEDKMDAMEIHRMLLKAMREIKKKHLEKRRKEK